MSYPYPPMGPGEQPPGGQPGGWGGTPPPEGGYGPSGPDWQHQETMMGAPMTPPGRPPMAPPAAVPTFGPPPTGQPPMGQYPMGGPPMGPPPRKSSAGVIVAVIAAAVVVVGGALGGAYYAAAHGGSGNKPAAASSTGAEQPPGAQPGSSNGQYKPTYYNATKSWSLWDSLNTAASDSKPLSLSEVFADAESRSQTNSIEHITMNLQGQGRLDSDCGATVWGAGLKSALGSYGCTQVVRAVYVSSDQRWVGELAIFNLRDVNAANALLQDLDPKGAAKGFFLPLTGQPPADRFGRGTTAVSGGAYGHFVVMGWAGHADGSQDSRFGTDTIFPASLTEQAGKEFLFTRNTS